MRHVMRTNEMRFFKPKTFICSFAFMKVTSRASLRARRTKASRLEFCCLREHPLYLWQRSWRIVGSLRKRSSSSFRSSPSIKSFYTQTVVRWRNDLRWLSRWKAEEEELKEERRVDESWRERRGSYFLFLLMHNKPTEESSRCMMSLQMLKSTSRKVWSLSELLSLLLLL